MSDTVTSEQPPVAVCAVDKLDINSKKNEIKNTVMFFIKLSFLKNERYAFFTQKLQRPVWFRVVFRIPPMVSIEENQKIAERFLDDFF
jgi:hypothetical protein